MWNFHKRKSRLLLFMGPNCGNSTLRFYLCCLPRQESEMCVMKVHPAPWHGEGRHPPPWLQGDSPWTGWVTLLVCRNIVTRRLYSSSEPLLMSHVVMWNPAPTFRTLKCVEPTWTWTLDTHTTYCPLSDIKKNSKMCSVQILKDLSFFIKGSFFLFFIKRVHFKDYFYVRLDTFTVQPGLTMF